ncbi:Rna polymerase ii c-terminal domain phosphatase-like, partial [Thalictrum thalictroides]
PTFVLQFAGPGGVAGGGSWGATIDGIKDAISPPETTTLDPRHIASLQSAVASLLSSILQPTPGMIPFPLATSSIKPVSTVGPAEPSLKCSPAREEGEVPESELDPDTRRRLLILQHGQDTRSNLK